MFAEQAELFLFRGGFGPAMFAAMVATRTTDTHLPALLTSVSRTDTSVIALMLQSIYRDLEGGAGNMMAHSIPCSGTDPANRLRRARGQASKSLLPEPFDNRVVTDEFCRDILSPRRSKKAPALSGDMPVLFVTGDLDDRTPIETAQTALKGFRRGRSVIVRNGGHELLVEEQVRKLVASFFQGDEVAQTNISLNQRTFMSVIEAAQPPIRRR